MKHFTTFQDLDAYFNTLEVIETVDYTIYFILDEDQMEIIECTVLAPYGIEEFRVIAAVYA